MPGMTAASSPAANHTRQSPQAQAFTLCIYAVGLLEQGESAQAITVIQQALSLAPGFAPGWLELGNAHMQAEQLAEAIRAYERALQRDPTLHEAAANLAMAYRQQGRADAAIQAYRAALALHPGDSEALTDLGLLLQEKQQWSEACDVFQQAHSLAPSRTLQLRIAELLMRQGDRQGALSYLLQALKSLEGADDTADKAQILAAIGSLFHQLGCLEEAIASYGYALMLQPGWVEISDHRNRVLEQLRTVIGQARQWCGSLSAGHQTSVAEAGGDLGADPSAEALARLGRLLHRAGCLDEAIATYAQALALVPHHEALVSLRAMAIEQSQDSQQLLAIARRFNLLGLFDEELRTLEQAAVLAPDHRAIQLDRALSLLRCGHFAEGWPLFEWRLQPPNQPLPLPRWQPGMACERLLILPERALGDQIMLASMLRQAASLASRQALLVDDRLYRLFARSFPHLKVLRPGQLFHSAQFQGQIRLGSLGGHLRPSKAHFLANRQAYLVADPAKIQALRCRHRPEGGLLVGISWRSTSPANGVMKSLPLSTMAAALALPAVRLISLQYGDTQAERAELRRATGLAVTADPEIDSFNAIDDLAALIAACDLVVSVSNTTAHLAGALGQRTWLLIDSRLDWRWGLDDEDSLWYPEARIFRQAAAGDWATPLAAMQQHLEQLRTTASARGGPEARGLMPTLRKAEAGGGAGALTPLGSWEF